MTRSSVDLPQPEGPISEMNSPAPTSRSMSWSAVTPPRGNVLVTPRRETTGVQRAHAQLLRRAAHDELLREHDGEEEADAEQRRDRGSSPTGSRASSE